MKKKLILDAISSTDIDVDLKYWFPACNEEVLISLDLNIRYLDGEEGSNMFYVTLSTPEALRKFRKGSILVRNRTIIVSEYDYNIVREVIIEILDKCSRQNWEDSCAALQRYFLWEYEDYSTEAV